MKIKNIFLLSMLSLLLFACSDSKEKVNEDMLDSQQKITEILKTVKDDATATKAIEDIKSLEKEFDDLHTRFEKLGEAENLKKNRNEQELKEFFGEDLFEKMKKNGKAMGEELKRIKGVLPNAKYDELNEAIEKTTKTK